MAAHQAALALDAGDAISALQAVALKDDPYSLALRGTAMARIGDFERAKSLFRRAEKGFLTSDKLARARCVLARAEVQLAMRDGGWPTVELEAAGKTFQASGDIWNSIYLKLVEARRAILLSRLDEAEDILEPLEHVAQPALRAVANLLRTHVYRCQLRLDEARAALSTARRDLRHSDHKALLAELSRAEMLLATPVAFCRSGEELHALTPDAMYAVHGSGKLIVDESRFEVRQRETVVSLVTRPVLFSLLKCLASTWPADSPRAQLIKVAFGGRQVDESHRVRLRMEMLRLRRQLSGLSGVVSTAGGYRLEPKTAASVVTLVPLISTRYPQLMALLSDGEAWTSLAIAEAMDLSRRSVQRSLEVLRREGLVQAQGAGPARRWRAVSTDPFATAMLLPK